MNRSILKYWIISVILLSFTARINCQNELPEVFKEGTLPEQLKYLEEHTKIYQDFRAIREDMFRNISRNTLDTLAHAKGRITGLILQTKTLNNQIDTLKKSLEATNNKLREMTRSKDSISVLGLGVNKVTYNAIMWTILGALVMILLIGFLSFRQNRIITLRTKKDLKDLKEEFDAYHTKTRLEREKMTVDHFNEIKKLKGK